MPAEAPAVSWQTYDAEVMLPVSGDYGPQHRDSAVWTCFAHNPDGAAIAAAYLTYGLGSADYRAVAEAGAVNNSARETWLAVQQPSDHTAAPGEAAEVAGYQIVSYSPSATSVRLGAEHAPITVTALADLVWDDAAQDWKVDLSRADPTQDGGQIGSLDGYTLWPRTSGSLRA